MLLTNNQRGDNVMDVPVNQLDKRKVQIGFIGLGLMGEPAYAAFTYSRLERSSMES